MTKLKDRIIDSLYQHFEAHVEKHKTNVLVMLENPMAIHDHTDLMTAIENELTHIAEYKDKIEALDGVLR